MQACMHPENIRCAAVTACHHAAFLAKKICVQSLLLLLQTRKNTCPSKQAYHRSDACVMYSMWCDTTTHSQCRLLWHSHCYCSRNCSICMQHGCSMAQFSMSRMAAAAAVAPNLPASHHKCCCYPAHCATAADAGSTTKPLGSSCSRWPSPTTDSMFFVMASKLLLSASIFLMDPPMPSSFVPSLL